MKKILPILIWLLALLGVKTSFAQLSGTVTVPGTYPTLSAAITALNTSGVSAATTIEVTGDQNAPTGGFVINTFTGASATNLVTIKAIGTVNLIPAVGTTTNTDGVVKFNGADFVTIEGFTITENPLNTTATQQMEWGIAVLSASATNSSQNITVKNCIINLNGTAANTAEIGIYAAHHSTTATTALTPTSAAGTYANLKIIGCTIDNAYTGISIGISGSATNLDANVTVGEMGAGNTITNFGGAATQAYGIRLEYATNANINYNTVDNSLITTHTTTLDGIYNTNGASQSLTVTNNVVKVTRGSSTSQLSAIRNIGYTGAVTWSNNEVTGCVATGTGVVYLMYNTAAATTLNISGNNIHDNSGIATTSGVVYLIYNTGLVSNSLTVSNNTISNNQINSTGTVNMFYNTAAVNNISFTGNTLTNNGKVTATTGSFYGYWNSSSPTGGTETISNNIISGQCSNGFAGVNYGIYSSTSLTQDRICSNNVVEGLYGSTTMYCMYLLSANNNTITNNKVRNINQTGTGTTYLMYNTGNNCNRSGNKLSNINFLGSTGTLYGIYAASTNQNNVSNDTLMDVTGTLFTAYTCYIAGSAIGANINNNYIDNINGVNTFGGLYLTGTNITANNNTIKNITGGTGSTTGTIYGVYVSNASSVHNIYNNTFENFINKGTTTGSMHGLFITSGATVNMYKNRFKNFSNTSGTTNRLNCINFASGTTVNAYNNLFSGFSAGTSTDGAALNAILVSNTSTTAVYNFYNNTFRLTGTLNNAGATGIFFNATSSSINSINNIFDVDVNAIDLTKSVAMIRKATAAGVFNYATTSNNNIFYLPNNTNAFYYIEGLTTATPFSGGISPNATPITGITDAVFNTPCSTTKLLLSGRDNATFYEQITFVNDIPTGITHAESGGVTLALVTDDNNGTTRTSPPDIGAFEFSGTAIVSDVTGPTISYTNLPNSICTNSVPLTATITDASGINNTSNKPRVWFKKSSEPNALPATNTSIDAGWKYAEATNSTSPFAFNLDFSLLNTPVVAGEVIQYFIAAQDLMGNVTLNQVVLKNSFCAASVALDTAGFPTATTPKSFTIISPPSIVNTVSSKSSICSSGVTTLTLNGDPSTGANYQWQSSPSLTGSYADIVGATSSSYNATITNGSNLNFQCIVKCGNTPIITSTPVSVNYYDPQVLSVTNGTRCGAGTVDLSATISANAIGAWYSTPTGGTPLANGSTFTTPNITATTNYYVEAIEGGTGLLDLGLANRVGATTNSGYSDIGLMFNALQPFTLNSVALYPVATTPSGNVTVGIALKNSAGTILQSTTVSLPTSVSPGVKNVVTLNFDVPAGTGHRLVLTSATGGGITGFIREATTGYTYPYTNSLASITSAYTGGASSAYYYYFYDWKTSAGCNSPRQIVTATVTTPPTITMPANITMCSNDPAQALTVSSTNAGYSYEWGPSAGLNTTSGATVQVLPSTTTAYKVTATDNSGGTFNGCSTTGDVTVTLNEIPAASETKSNRDTICFSDNVVLSLLNTGNATGLTYQWQKSSNGSTYSDISGETNATFSTLITQSSDRFYQCKIFCKGNLALTSTPKELIINAPSVTSVTGATRCGTGNVTLSAVAGSANEVLKWYDVASGGTALGTGPTFVTPPVTSSTSYYVSSSLGGGGIATPTLPAYASSYTGNVRGMWFTAPFNFTITSLKVPSQVTGTGTDQSFAVVKFAATPPTYSAVTNTFTTLYLNQASPGLNAVNCSIPIQAGDIIGILSQKGNVCAYGPTAPSINLGGFPVTLYRLGMQFPLNTTAPKDLWYEASSIGITEFTYSVGCESPRTPVDITVLQADAVTASADVTICSNGTGTPLSVTSSNSNYSYNWGPSNGLTTTTGSTVNANPSSNTSYIVTASDASTGCQNQDTVNVTVNQVPISIDVKASLDTICVSDNTTLSLFNTQPNAATGLDYQWQSSLNGINYTDISGANTNAYTVLINSSSDRYYRCNLTCLGSPGVVSNPKEIILSDPQIANINPGTRCGAGSVTLSANSTNPNDIIRWYAAATGGIPLAIGTTFNTPIITTSTDYYVAASNGGSIQPLGLANRVGSTTNSGYSDIGLMFNALQSFTLKSVAVYPVATTPSGNVTFTVQLKNSAGTVLQSQVFTLPTAVSPGVKQTIQLNFPVPVGTGHRLVLAGATGGGITGFIREVTTGYSYPYTIPGVASITSAYTGGASASYYYYFYDWQVATGCESTRTVVSATVTPAPTFTISNSNTICNNSIMPLSVTSGTSNYNNFTWAPITELYSDASAVNAYTGGNATTVYFKTSSSGNKVITATANDSNTGCANIADVTITNLPNPNIISTYPELCISGSTTLSLNPTSGYSNATFEWLESSNGSTYSTISSATNTSYSTSTINSSTYYKAKVYDGNNNLCAEPVFYLNVNNPSVSSTLGATACPGSTVTLSATASGTGTIKWYDVATNGTSLATGNLFTTPVLATSKTYYVESVEGGGGTTSTGLINGLSTGTSGIGTTNYGIVFDALQAFTLKSVKIYPISATGGSGTVTIDVINSSGTIMHTKTFNVTGSPIGSLVATTVDLDFNIVPGTNYKIRPGTISGITGLQFEPSASAPGGNYGYPMGIPGVVTITTSTLTAAPTNTARNDLYYYFYNWQVVTGCASARVPVVATINSCPRVNAKVFLANVNPTTGLMDDYIKTLANFPLSDPYAQSGAYNGNYNHVNSGSVATTTPTVINTLGNNAIVDWVFLELRQGTSGATSVVATKVGLLQKDGDVVGMDGVSPIQFTAPAGNYFLAVRHRNHIGFRTNSTVALSATPTTLNFTNNSVALYGSFPVNIISATVNAMNGGDANSDGSIDAFDTITWEVENGLFDDYNLNSDYNLDGSVDAFDSIEWELNNGKYQELD